MQENKPIIHSERAKNLTKSEIIREDIRHLLYRITSRRKQNPEVTLTEEERAEAEALREELFAANEARMASDSVETTPWDRQNDLVANIEESERAQETNRRITVTKDKVLAEISKNIKKTPNGDTCGDTYSQTGKELWLLMHGLQKSLSSFTIDVLNNNGHPTLNEQDARRCSSFYCGLINGCGDGIFTAQVVSGNGRDGYEHGTMKADESRYRIKVTLISPEAFSRPTHQPKEEKPLRQVWKEQNRESANAAAIRELMRMIEDMDVKTASEINNLEPTQFVDVTNHGRNFLYSSNYVAPEASMGMIVLGRRTEQQRETNDVNFDNNAVSRRHAQIERKMITDENGKWIRTGLVVTDLDSKNGTFINGERLQPRVAKEAPEGSIIELGTIKGEAFIVRNCNLVPYADFYQKRKEKVESLKATDKYKAEIELPKAEVQLQEANRELARLRALETNRTIIEIAVNQIAEQITIDNVESYLLGETILLDPTHRIPFERSILPQGKTEITLGVLPENDYQLVGPRSEEISRRHAIIRRSSNRLFIEDTSSLNGTYVNGNDIRGSGQIELQEGAVIEFVRGVSEMRYVVKSGEVIKARDAALIKEVPAERATLIRERIEAITNSAEYLAKQVQTEIDKRSWLNPGRTIENISSLLNRFLVRVPQL